MPSMWNIVEEIKLRIFLLNFPKLSHLAAVDFFVTVVGVKNLSPSHNTALVDHGTLGRSALQQSTLVE